MRTNVTLTWTLGTSPSMTGVNIIWTQCGHAAQPLNGTRKAEDETLIITTLGWNIMIRSHEMNNDYAYPW